MVSKLSVAVRGKSLGKALGTLGKALGTLKQFRFAESLRLMTVEWEGAQASQGARNHKFLMVALPENARERAHVAIRPTEALRLVVFLPARESLICLSPIFSNRCYSEDGNNSRTRGRMR